MITVNKLQPGTYLHDQPLAILSATEKQTRHGAPYLEAILSDKTGQIQAKVWEDSLKNAHLEVGKVAFVSGRVGEYQGNLDLTISSARTSDQENFDQYLSTIPTLVFDIETVGRPLDQLGEWEKNYFLENLEKDTDPQEAAAKTGLYALYGSVQSIGLTNPESGRGEVLSLTDKPIVPKNKKFKCHSFKQEAKLLNQFWQTANQYERFVTYNGRGFDWPFLAIRSAINQIRLPFILDHYNQNRFIDLQDKFRQGRAFKLEAICRAFNITNPKAQGISGLHVTNLYHQGDHQAIADYVTRDVIATTKLYNLWRKYMSGHLNF